MKREKQSNFKMTLLCRSGETLIGQCRVLDLDMRVFEDMKSGSMVKNSHSNGELAKLGVKLERKEGKLVLERIEL